MYACILGEMGRVINISSRPSDDALISTFSVFERLFKNLEYVVPKNVFLSAFSAPAPFLDILSGSTRRFDCYVLSLR